MTPPHQSPPGSLSQRYRSLSLAKKMVVLIATVAGVVTIVSMLASFVIELTSFRGRLIEEYVTTARMTASNLEAAVGFRDEYDSNDILSVLSQRKHIACAVVYLNDGSILAQYRRQDLDAQTELPGFETKTQTSRNFISVSEPINLKGSTLGRIVLQAELNELNSFINARILVFISLVIASLGIAIVLAKRLGSHISRPIIELARTAARITEDHDFSTRQERLSDDETGQLVDAFNEMMSVIENRSDELVKAKDTAEASSRAKDDFLSVISHELRTPLNPIIGYVEILLQKAKDAEDKKQLNLVRQYAEHLQRLIDHVIDYSRFERGSIPLYLEPVDYRQLCDNVNRLMLQEATEKGITLTSKHQIDPALSPTISADRVKLQQAVLNLVTNALKFTKQGSVEICTHLAAIDSGSALLRIAVSDTGIGIEEKNKGLVFKPFSQIDVGLTRKYSGLGLGLAITRNIVEAMGGKIDFESTAAKGTTFWVEIPFALTSQPDTNLDEANVSIKTESSESRKVLLVDDQLVNLELGEFMLASCGHQVVTARGGQEAIEHFQKERFDLVILDIKMPVMDGYETARNLRKLETGQVRTPIIAMTAHVNSRGNAQCIEAGMDDSMPKPFNTERLNEIISKWLDT